LQKIITAITFPLAILAAVQAAGQTTVETAPPVKTYALVAAVGQRFSISHEVWQIGSQLPPYERTWVDAPDNILNRSVLQGLQKAVAEVDANGKQVYLSLDGAELEGVPLGERENVALAKVVAELKKMPQRADWYRIIVATPAFQGMARDGMASRLQGIGIFTEPLCQGQCREFEGVDPPKGMKALSAKNKPIKAGVYLAPYSFIKIWVLDPNTLEVLDTQTRFDNVKLSNPESTTRDINRSFTREFIAEHISGVIEKSVHEGVRQALLRGTVNVGELKEVKPDTEKNQDGPAKKP
jgi:hypothetical protein